MPQKETSETLRRLNTLKTIAKPMGNIENIEAIEPVSKEINRLIDWVIEAAKEELEEKDRA